jgi:hypothetical protein
MIGIRIRSQQWRWVRCELVPWNAVETPDEVVSESPLTVHSLSIFVVEGTDVGDAQRQKRIALSIS